MDYLQQIYVKFFGGTGEPQSGGNSFKIVAFGNVLLDRTVELSDTALLEKYKLPPGSKGELTTEILKEISAEACMGDSCKANAGGSALNSMRIVKSLGLEALFFGAVGNDKEAEQLSDILKDSGVETNFETIDEMPTGQCLALVHNGTNTLYANIGASAKFSIDHLKQAAQKEKSFLRSVERKQILYVEGFFIPDRVEVCRYIVDNYIRDRRRLAFNLSAPYIVKQNFEDVMYMVRNAYFIFGNESEFQELVNSMDVPNVEQMAMTLLQGTPRVIVITKGGAGVQLITNYVDETASPGAITFHNFNVTRPTVEVDGTGAGDAFAAAFLVAWLEKRIPTECVRVASDVAAHVVTQIGCNLPPDFVRK